MFGLIEKKLNSVLFDKEWFEMKMLNERLNLWIKNVYSIQNDVFHLRMILIFLSYALMLRSRYKYTSNSNKNLNFTIKIFMTSKLFHKILNWEIVSTILMSTLDSAYTYLTCRLRFSHEINRFKTGSMFHS